jgi:hypothetical protein
MGGELARNRSAWVPGGYCAVRRYLPRATTCILAKLASQFALEGFVGLDQKEGLSSFISFLDPSPGFGNQFGDSIANGSYYQKDDKHDHKRQAQESEYVPRFPV